jgi:hypothetical protein
MLTGVVNGSVMFEMNRNFDGSWFVGCRWEDLNEKHSKRSCWNRLTLDKLPEWIEQITREIDAGRFKGNEA